jgi:hypothetical protein
MRVLVDSAICLTTGVVLISAVGLVVILVNGWGTWVSRVVLIALLLAGAVGTYLARPENFRAETGPTLPIVEVGGAPEVEVDLIGSCLSLFRRVGPLSFIVGRDFFPGGSWDRGPVSFCELMGQGGSINLPDSVRSGEWMLCDYATCYPLTNVT